MGRSKTPPPAVAKEQTSADFEAKQLARAEAKMKKAEEDDKNKSVQSFSSNRDRSPSPLRPSPQADKAASKSDKPDHSKALLAVFKLFDLDGNGTIESSEMMQLGEARRKLGQVSGTWDKAKNDKLMEKLGGGRSGQVSFLCLEKQTDHSCSCYLPLLSSS